MSPREVLRLEVVDFLVATVAGMAPEARSALAPGVWAKSLPLCPGAGLVRPLCGGAVAALSISATATRFWWRCWWWRQLMPFKGLLMSHETPVPWPWNGLNETSGALVLYVPSWPFTCGSAWFLRQAPRSPQPPSHVEGHFCCYCFNMFSCFMKTLVLWHWS